MGNALGFARDPLRFLEDTATMGPVARVQLYARPFFLLTTPELVKAGLVTHARHTRKDDLFEHIKRALGDGLATSEGALWHRQRRFMAPAFTPRAVEAYADTIVDATARTVDRWSSGDRVELHEVSAQITLEIVSRVLFGASVQVHAKGVFDALEEIGDYYVTALASPIHLPNWTPIPGNLRFVRSVRRVRRIVESLVAAQQARGAEDNLLSDLLFGRREDPHSMDPVQIIDECMTFFIAGHETSGLALRYALHALLQRPSVANQVRDEVSEVLGTRRASSADVQGLARTEHVVREALRLYPPAWITARRAIEDFELGGYRVQRGDGLMFSPWVAHRDPTFFPRPTAFLPERWSGDLMRTLPRYAYFPFGAGPRVCLGNQFAMTELVLALATIMQDVDLHLESSRPIEHSLSVTLRPKRPTYATVTRRSRRTIAPHGRARLLANRRDPTHPGVAASRRYCAPTRQRSLTPRRRDLDPESSAGTATVGSPTPSKPPPG